MASFPCPGSTFFPTSLVPHLSSGCPWDMRGLAERMPCNSRLYHFVFNEGQVECFATKAKPGPVSHFPPLCFSPLLAAPWYPWLHYIVLSLVLQEETLDPASQIAQDKKCSSFIAEAAEGGKC